MTIAWIACALVFCALLWWALDADMARYMRKAANRPLMPESLFRVVIDESDIVAHRPDGSIERCAISELSELYIVTTSAGPWSPDVWWVFVGSSGTGCSFPSGATGEDDALAFAQRLPGFDNAAFISAMGSANDAKFLCWRAAACQLLDTRSSHDT